MCIKVQFKVKSEVPIFCRFSSSDVEAVVQSDEKSENVKKVEIPCCERRNY